jgi:hypothetical protein
VRAPTTIDTHATTTTSTADARSGSASGRSTKLRRALHPHAHRHPLGRYGIREVMAVRPVNRRHRLHRLESCPCHIAAELRKCRVDSPIEGSQDGGGPVAVGWCGDPRRLGVGVGVGEAVDGASQHLGGMGEGQAEPVVEGMTGAEPRTRGQP